MNKLSYAEQLRHPFWQKKRLQILERDNWECVSCLSKEKTLHVHHKRYVKGLLAWEYEPIDLATFCEDCHADDHAAMDLLKEMIARSGLIGTPAMLVSVVGGMLAEIGAIDSVLAEKARAFDSHKFDRCVLLSSASGLASEKQMIDFVRLVHQEFEYGPADISPLALAVIEHFESGLPQGSAD